MSNVDRTSEQYVKGFVKRARRIGVPSMPTLPRETEQVRSEAYKLATANRHKPWARRYLRQLMRGI